MPLYRLHCIAAHYTEYRHIKDLVTQSAKLLLDNGSAVREIRFHGTKRLPQRMKRHKAFHQDGDYWSMHFDAPPRLLTRLNDQMRSDPRVIRWTTLKLGEKLEDVVDERVNTTVFLPSDAHSSASSTGSIGGGIGVGGGIGGGIGGGVGDGTTTTPPYRYQLQEGGSGNGSGSGRVVPSVMFSRNAVSSLRDR